MKKAEEEARFDGKWVLVTDTNLSAEAVALKYKELWQAERVFRDMKSMLETRPVYHHNDASIAGYVFLQLSGPCFAKRAGATHCQC